MKFTKMTAKLFKEAYVTYLPPSHQNYVAIIISLMYIVLGVKSFGPCFVQCADDVNKAIKLNKNYLWH